MVTRLKRQWVQGHWLSPVVVAMLLEWFDSDWPNKVVDRTLQQRQKPEIASWWSASKGLGCWCCSVMLVMSECPILYLSSHHFPKQQQLTAQQQQPLLLVNAITARAIPTHITRQGHFSNWRNHNISYYCLVLSQNTIKANYLLLAFHGLHMYLLMKCISTWQEQRSYVNVKSSLFLSQ